MKTNRLINGIAATIITAFATALAAQQSVAINGMPDSRSVTDELIVQAPDDEWLSYGHDYGEQRYSGLTQITDTNVDQLKLAWFADLDTARGQEGTPLMHDGTLFISTAWSLVKAYDATTGKLKWSYDPKVPRETLARACCDAVNRGIAIYGHKIYIGTLDGRLVALDEQTGKEIFAKIVVPNQLDYTITGAPRIVKGKVLIGSGGAEFKARGYIAAHDPETGRQLWKFYTVPGNPAAGFENRQMEAAAKTWAGEWWKLGGGGTVWDSITYDPATNLILFGTGNAEPWSPAAANRKGDSLFTSSIVAVNADTGEYAWHFQETPEDRWDFDSNAQITIADLTIGGRKRHVAIHAPKNGHLYILDVATGQFISATPFVPVNWATKIDPITGTATINPAARYENDTDKPFIGLPGALGAHSWQAQSFSPKTGLLYIPAHLMPYPYLAARNWQPSDIGFQTGLNYDAIATPADPKARASAKAVTTGALIAWNPVSGKEIWRVDYPSPWNGGLLSTAGNLVFQGDATGQFSAFNATTGLKRWTFSTQSGVIAPPISYAVDGQQYIAILVGWGGVFDIGTGILARKTGAYRNISRLMVFKLNGTAQLPPPPPSSKLPLDPPPFSGTPEQVTYGARIYSRYCVVCHGDNAVAGGVNPDLRHSGALGSPDAIHMIVNEGLLHDAGMVSFKSVLKPGDAEAIRQFLIKRANEDKLLGDD